MKQLLIFVGLIFSFNSFSQDLEKKDKDNTFEILFTKKNQRYLDQPFPKFEIKDSSELIFSNKDLNNKITFINFGFKACPPCIAEIEGFNKMYEKLKDSVNFLFVYFTSDSESTIEEFVSNYNIKYKIFHIDKEECYRMNLKNGFPTSFILDKNGLIKYFRVGGQTDKEKATDQVLTKIYPSIMALF
jgi:peroxiredoxin